MTKKANNTAAPDATPANPCPNAGSLIIDEATQAGIGQMCDNVSDTLRPRLKKLFTAAVQACQLADNESDLAGVRRMVEFQLADLFAALECDCNQQLNAHVTGCNPFAEVYPEILIA